MENMGCSSRFRIIPRGVTVVNSEKMIITSFAATSLERIQKRQAQSCDKLSIGEKKKGSTIEMSQA